jgi:hypothetical protein
VSNVRLNGVISCRHPAFLENWSFVQAQQKEKLLASIEGPRRILELRLYASGAYMPERIPSSRAFYSPYNNHRPPSLLSRSVSGPVVRLSRSRN